VVVVKLWRVAVVFSEGVMGGAETAEGGKAVGLYEGQTKDRQSRLKRDQSCCSIPFLWRLPHSPFFFLIRPFQLHHGDPLQQQLAPTTNNAPPPSASTNQH
jgi:hypothetical protein